MANRNMRATTLIGRANPTLSVKFHVVPQETI